MTVAALLVSWHVLLAYGLPIGVTLLLILVLAWLYRRGGPLAAVTVTLSLVVGTLLAALTLKLTGLDQAIYYRPDEQLTEFHHDKGHRAYRRDTTLTMRMPHGDLGAMTRADVAEPHEVTYHIDRYGFRNDRDYHGQRFLLVGDSFIIGSSNTQTDSLAAQLSRTHAIDTYSLAHPGGLPDYAAYVTAFRRHHASGLPGSDLRGLDARVLLFLFEGNDFVNEENKERSRLHRLWKRYYEMYSGTSLHRFTKSLYKRASRRSRIRGNGYVSLFDLGGRPAAMLTRYVEETRKPAADLPADFAQRLTALAPQIERVFFIPTGYRVYHDEIMRRQRSSENLSDANWMALSGLCGQLGLHCVNLTPALRAAARDALGQGRLLWWRDDTHWNGHGIAVAARIVAAEIGEGSR